MKMLATDLDRTLLPNGRWPSDADAIAQFNELTQRYEVLVVYVTGRSLALTEQAITQYRVRHPDVLIGDVGTTVSNYGDGAWAPDSGWRDHVMAQSPRWDAEAARAALRGVSGLAEQERVHCGPLKQSYYVDHERREAVLAEVEQRIAERFDEVIIYSFDSQSGMGLLDVLPRSATKQTALEYVAAAHAVSKPDVVFCGDSGNDLLPLTAGFSGVLVRNADEQLIAGVNQAVEADPALRVYFAQGDFRGLNGYYTSGVIEGAFHYGLFGASV